MMTEAILLGATLAIGAGYYIRKRCRGVDSDGA